MVTLDPRILASGADIQIEQQHGDIDDNVASDANDVKFDQGSL